MIEAMRRDGAGGRSPALGRNLTFSIVDIVGAAIVGGEFAGRPFPIEADLARHFSVSHSVTREAVKMLTAKGLLSARPRQGTMVQPEPAWNLLDPDVMRWLVERKPSLSLRRQIVELRLAIEPAAAALAARVATPTAIASMQRILGQLAPGGDDGVASVGPVIAFHALVLETSGNPFYARFRDLIAIAVRSSAPLTSGDALAEAFETRMRIVKAIRAGNDKDAASAMRTLIANTAE
jgi:DNA-binding FadR family transcriptional regulator